jgi:hypothetical protein
LSICYLEDKMEPAFCFFKLGYLVYIAVYLLVKLCGKATASYSIVQWNASVMSLPLCLVVMVYKPNSSMITSWANQVTFGTRH